MKWVIVLPLLAIAACKSGPICFITSADIQRSAPQKLLIGYGSGQKISSLSDPGWDSTKGGVYQFYGDDHLKSYTFYQNDKKPVYREEYNDNGMMTHSEGSPMVDRIITEVGTDSAYFQIYFFKLQKTFQNLKITINQGAPMQFPVNADSTYSNLGSVSFGLNTTDMTRLNIFTRIEYLDNCTRVDHVLTDTLRLIKNPQLSPAEGGN